MAVRNDFAPGEVLQAQDVNDTFASKVDYALPVNAQTGTTYTFVAADAEKLTTASNASPVTLTIPPASSVAWPDNTVLRVVNYGAGAVTVDGGSGVTVTNTASTIAQYGAAVAIRTGSDAWTLVPFGGGDIPAAEVSSPAATGQYTDTGVTYDYYTFTASGTLTVDEEGTAEILIVGGAGGGGAGGTDVAGGSGGAGGYLYETVFLSPATYTVTVGAGGAASTTGNASRFNTMLGVGGGAGASGTGLNSGSGGRAGGAGASGGGGTSSTFNTNRGAGGSGIAGQGNNGNQGGWTVAPLGQGGGAGGTPTGLANSITGSSVTYAVGGGGGSDGTANRGNGGFRGVNGGAGGSGGSGIVVVRVRV